MTTPVFPTLSKSYSTFGYKIKHLWGTIVSPKASGLEGRMATQRQPQRRFTWPQKYLPARDCELVQGFLYGRMGGVEAFNITVFDKVWSPYDAPVLSQSAGGTLAGRTYYVRFTWSDGTNQTLYSQRASLAVDANKFLTVTLPTFPTNVDYAYIYIGTVSGSETFVSKFPTSGSTFTEAQTAVDADSASGQAVLRVTATTNFNVGDLIVIDDAGTGGGKETATILTIQDGVSLTLTTNLTYAHTQVQADEVKHAPDEGAALPTSNTLEETVKVYLEGDPEVERTRPLYYGQPLVMIESLV